MTENPLKEVEKQSYEMEISLIQPWSVPVLKTKLPPDILQIMTKISDQIIADKKAENYGHQLVGQIEKELKIENTILEQTGVISFFLEAVRQFVIHCKCQMMPYKITSIKQEEWLIQIMTMWVVSQQPGEYNPIHIHTQCDISSVMYLKIPEILPSRKTHHEVDDGSILFTNNCSRDLHLSAPIFTMSPQVGDLVIFGAQQQHGVYPYRCAEGQEDVERRSISFNATFQSKTDYDEAAVGTWRDGKSL